MEFSRWKLVVMFDSLFSTHGGRLSMVMGRDFHFSSFLSILIKGVSQCKHGFPHIFYVF